MTKKMHKYSSKKLSRGEPPNHLGQHLLHNKQILHEVVRRAHIGKNDTVLELGAGRGALTTILNKQAGQVLAVEYDETFVSILQSKTKKDTNTIIIHKDILKLKLPKKEYVVVASIPYAITTPIMRMLLNHPSGAFRRGVIVMEKGAAKRFTANFIKQADVLVWRMWFDITYIKGISRKNFSPSPQVDSAIISIERRKQPFVTKKDYLAFFGLAQYALKNPYLDIDTVLKGIFTAPQRKHLKKSLGIKQPVAIGSLSEKQWGIIFQTMNRYVPRRLWPRVNKQKLRKRTFSTKQKYKQFKKKQ